MLKHGDIIKINLKPYFPNCFFYGKIIDYSHIFNADRHPFFIHVFESYDRNLVLPRHLFVNPIPIKHYNIFLQFEKRIKLISNENVMEKEFARSMMFREAGYLWEETQNLEFSIFDIELGLSTLDVKHNLSESVQLELIDLYTIYNIVNRISIEKMKNESIELELFQPKLKKDDFNELKLFYRLYENSPPYKTLSTNSKKSISIDWSILKNSKYEKENYFKFYRKKKPNYGIFFDFSFEFYIYDPIFQKYCYRATSYYWAAVIFTSLFNLNKKFVAIDISKLKFEILDNTRFTFYFNSKFDRNTFFDLLSIEVCTPIKIKKWLKQIKKEESILDEFLYKHPSQLDYKASGIVAKELVKVDTINCKSSYINLFKYVTKSKIEFGIEIMIFKVFEFKVISEDRVDVDGYEVGKKMKAVIKNLLKISRSNFLIDDESDSVVFILKNEKDFEIIRDYFISIFSSKEKITSWLLKYFAI